MGPEYPSWDGGQGYDKGYGLLRDKGYDARTRTTPHLNRGANQMSRSMSEAREYMAEVASGVRCYDCGKKFETPIPTNEAEQAQTEAEWAERYPSHARCFQ